MYDYVINTYVVITYTVEFLQISERRAHVYVDIVILATLSVRPQHGYEIKRSVGRVLGPEANLNNGVLYPTLRRLEEMGALEREVERHEGKPDRHVYRLSGLGHEVLHDLLTEFPPEVARNESEFLTRVSCFDLLEPAERRAILDARAADRRRSLERHAEILAMVEAERLTMSPYALETLAFDRQKTELELAWIEHLTHLAADGGADARVNGDAR